MACTGALRDAFGKLNVYGVRALDGSDPFFDGPWERLSRRYVEAVADSNGHFEILAGVGLNEKLVNEGVTVPSSRTELAHYPFDLREAIERARARRRTTADPSPRQAPPSQSAVGLINPWLVAASFFGLLVSLFAWGVVSLGSRWEDSLASQNVAFQDSIARMKVSSDEVLVASAKAEEAKWRGPEASRTKGTSTEPTATPSAASPQPSASVNAGPPTPPSAGAKAPGR